MNRRIMAPLLAATLCMTLMGAANSCGGSGGPARSASYAGDGNTQFGNGGTDYANAGAPGKLLFGVGYKAVAQSGADRSNCEWKVYSVTRQGVTRVAGKGGYGTANIKVEKPDNAKVYLRSVGCGLWKRA